MTEELFTGDDDLKRYYSIKEVADLFDVSKSLIRYWESEFSSIRPHKAGNGERRFTRQNIQQIHLIYHLVKERGFTLEGAKMELERRRNFYKEREEIINSLKIVRSGLVAMQQDLSSENN